MEDFPILLIFLVFYLIAGSSGKKKKGRRAGNSKAGPMRTHAQGEQWDQKAVQRDKQTLEGFETAFEKLKGDADCQQQRIHLHDVSQTDMLTAAEGEDPCHGGDSAAQRVGFDAEPEENEAQRSLREDVLRGVIMSEILMRPHERRALQRSR